MSYLAHCIYASAATREFQLSELKQILEASCRNNEQLGVTGILVYMDGSFFQVLEGDLSVIESLYKKISLDPRHDGVTRIISEAIPRRYFGDWSMGFSRVSRADLAEITGMNDFFSPGSSLASLDNGRARKLLLAFREGRWRRNVTGSSHLAAA